MNLERAIDHLKKNDPLLGELIDRLGECTLEPSFRSSFLSACVWAVLAQLVSTKSANTIYDRFTSGYGHNIDPETFLKIPPETLRESGIPGYKIKYLQNIALFSLENPAENLEILDDNEIIGKLTKIKGVGRWTVEMLLIFYFYRPDVLPVDDLGIKKAIRYLYGLPSPPDRKTIREIGAIWKPYRTVATWYLWRSLSDSILFIKL